MDTNQNNANNPQNPERKEPDMQEQELQQTQGTQNQEPEQSNPGGQEPQNQEPEMHEPATGEYAERPTGIVEPAPMSAGTAESATATVPFMQEPTPAAHSNKNLLVILAVGGVLILLALAALAWSLMGPKSTPASTTTTTTATPNTTTNKDKTVAPTTTTPAGMQNTVEYATIPEFGLKYKKTANQSHLSYTIKTDPVGKGAQFMTNIGGTRCPQHAAGYIEQTKEQAKGSDGTLIGGQKKIGNYWYYYISPQAMGCDFGTDKAAGDAVANETKIVQNEIFGTLEQQ